MKSCIIWCKEKKSDFFWKKRLYSLNASTYFDLFHRLFSIMEDIQRVAAASLIVAIILKQKKNKKTGKGNLPYFGPRIALRRGARIQKVSKNGSKQF